MARSRQRPRLLAQLPDQRRSESSRLGVCGAGGAEAGEGVGRSLRLPEAQVGQVLHAHRQGAACVPPEEKVAVQ
eukprot:scaffold2014_cov112-Isochrysis_galbana.AAC.4